jgi:hypothetical protein
MTDVQALLLAIAALENPIIRIEVVFAAGGRIVFIDEDAIEAQQGTPAASTTERPTAPPRTTPRPR